MQVAIRRAMQADAPIMADIHARSWRAAYEGIVSPEGIEQAVARQPQRWERLLAQQQESYLALVSGVPAGLIRFGACRDADLPEAGEIYAIYMAPEFMGKGCGAALMRFALETLRNRGFDTIAVWVLRDNKNAGNFYRHFGFLPDGAVQTLDLCGPVEAIRCRLDLSGTSGYL